MNNDEISNILSTVLVIMVGILFFLAIVYIIILQKIKKEEKNQNKNENQDMISKSKNQKSKKNTNSLSEKIEYNKQSIYEFMDFDKIEDGMIVRKNGRKFLMAIECQGVNYDLMSGLEKNGVEQGFLQFLNTLRYPIQLYIQTRTVNLESGILKYRQKVNEIRDRLSKKQVDLYRKQEMGYSVEEVNKAKLDVAREKNLYEYGLDIITNTEKMSLNKNILRKHYYVIIEYMPEDVSNLGREEISNMAFSELYTKAQTLINSLNVCGISGKVLDSNGLAELLYIAYNRDEAEIYDLNKALKAGYDELYLTAPNVLEKRMKELDKKIKIDANQLANDAVMEVIVEREEEQRVKQKEAEMTELIKEMAKMFINENESYIGKETAELAKNKIDKKSKKKKDKGGEDEKK
ncbi:MAG: hypothetical protein HUJ68_09480 [Clostridia bacterium]|nr:hypothetical protein [Clostridia bacterium]